MQCSVVSDVGPIANGVIKREEVMTEINNGSKKEEIYYVCETFPRQISQTMFHHTSVLPFGFQSITEVFSVVGRHTNKGIVCGVFGRYILVKPSAVLEAKVCPTSGFIDDACLQSVKKASEVEDLSTSISDFLLNMFRLAVLIKDKTDYEDGIKEVHKIFSTYDPTIEIYTFSEIDLPPPLDAVRFCPPHKVGSTVVARRFGCRECLFPATITAVQYSCTYSLLYKDGGRDFDVLHRDTLLLSDLAAEPCTVRDKVVVSVRRQQTVTITECCGDNKYRAVPAEEPDTIVEFTGNHIVYIVPMLKEALFSQVSIVNYFMKLDSSNSGSVAWKDVRHLLLNLEGYGKPLTFAEVGTLQRDLCILCGRMEPQFLSKVPVQEEEMRLSFAEFEIILLRALNML